MTPAVTQMDTDIGETTPTRRGGPGIGNVAPFLGSAAPLLIAAAIGGSLALSLGVYGRLHTPTGEPIADLGFPSLLAMKAWTTTLAAGLALVQLLSAAWLWGRLPGFGRAPSWVAHGHRWTGTIAFIATLPAAYHCLWSLGLQTTTPRVLAHSILGCAFYGVLTTKLLLLRSDRLPGWTLPAIGGLLVATLTAVWLTSSYWYFTTIAGPGS